MLQTALRAAPTPAWELRAWASPTKRPAPLLARPDGRKTGAESATENRKAFIPINKLFPPVNCTKSQQKDRVGLRPVSKLQETEARWRFSEGMGFTVDFSLKQDDRSCEAAASPRR